ncbi:MAG: GNAT family N-acetyltransferase [Bacteroidota bacterium]
MASPFQCRKLSNQDLEAYYYQLRLFSFKESPFAFSESYTDALAAGAQAFLEDINLPHSQQGLFTMGAFKANEELVGFVKFKRDQRSKALHKAMLHAMYIHPEYRGQKVGSLLMRHLFSIIQQMKGLEQIHLWVLSLPEVPNPAISFYQKFGFEITGPQVKKDLIIEGKYVDANYMVCYL